MAMKIKSVSKCILLIVLLTTLFAGCHSPKTEKISFEHLPSQPRNSEHDTATFAAGCFWCIEAQFKELKGVEQVLSGFSGGHVKDPTYTQVSLGGTGHAEVIQMVYNPRIVSYDHLLQGFFLAHDPTQLNRQGNDVGEQYRSAIFVHNKAQLDKVRYYIRKMTDEKLYDKPIVTQVEPFTVFYKAEDYHQNYYANNPDEAYCQYVIKPKLEKFKHIFSTNLKHMP